MVKEIIFIKDSEKAKVGEIYECSDKDAKRYIDNGYAEYIKEGVENLPQVKDIDFQVKQFEEFHSWLMSTAPKGYSPWFFPVKANGKDPDPKAILKIEPSSKGSWHHISAQLSKEQCVERLRAGGNIGISARNGDALIIGDIDELKYIEQSPRTLSITSRKRDGIHFFGWDKDGTAKINQPTDYGEMRSNNQYVVACGGYVPVNEKDLVKLSDAAKADKYLGYYTLRNETNPVFLTFDSLPAFFREKKAADNVSDAEVAQREEKKTYVNKGGKYSELFKLKMSDVVDTIPSNKRVGHPLHESDTDANFSLSKDGNLGHCWRHLVALNPVQYLCVKAGYSNCLDAGTPHKAEENGGRKYSKIKGDKKALEVAYNEAVKMKLIKEWEQIETQIDGNGKDKIELPGDDCLVSRFAQGLVDRLSKENILFFRQDSRQVIELGNIRNVKDEVTHTGFIPVTPSRFSSLIENYFSPWSWRTSFGRKYQVNKTANMTDGKIVLDSQIFQEGIPSINRIFNIQLPILYEGEIVFPNVGYDKRFRSWLTIDSARISDEEMTLEDAKKIIDKIFEEFCFKDDQDKTNALAGFITPFLRGLFTTGFNTRCPVFCYEANRERCGKDYLAGLTGMFYEGNALEESPISSGEKFSSGGNDELRKKIISAMISGKKRMHFPNNKGHLDSAVFEAVITARNFTDRLLGKNIEVAFDNEMDFSFSGNIGMTMTPDLANRTVFVHLFLAIEDANKREFETPDLHGWVIDNRNDIASALFAFIRNWGDKGCPAGTLPFASYPEWARIAGGIMEAAGYDSPCVRIENDTGISIDTDTSDMKELFEACYEEYPNQPITKITIKNVMSTKDIMTYFDWGEKADQTKFSMKLNSFKGRILSDIRMTVLNDKMKRTQDWKYIFAKIGGNH